MNTKVNIKVNIMKSSFLSKTIAVVLAMCLILSSAVFAGDGVVYSDVSNTYIKVGLLYADSAVEMVKLESDYGFLDIDCSMEGWGVVEDLTRFKELYVINYSGIPVLMDIDGEVMLPLYEGRGVMAAGPDLDEMIMYINGEPYRDGAVFTLNDNGTINVINYVSLEHYVWGVLFKEVGSVYPIEAIKAQAIVCRSYGLYNLNSHSKYGFDLCTTIDCQSYGGVSSEKDICTQACRETEGLVIKYDGKVANTCYFASSGGHTMNTEDLWVSAVPYLRAVDDPYSDDSSWAVEYSFEKISSRLVSNGYSIGDVKSIEVTNRTDYGAVLDLTFYGSDGIAVVSKSKIKSLLSLKTTFFDVEIPKDQEIQGRVSQGYIYVLGADGQTVKVNTAETVIYDGKSSVNGDGLDWTGLAIEFIEAEKDCVIFRGAGSGHCVGFSQTGAKNMAKQGFDYFDIINQYFTDVTIEQYKEQNKI